MKFILYLIALLSLCMNCNGGGAEVEENHITLSATSLSFLPTASSKTLEVTADAEWGISSNQTWCGLSPTGGQAGTTTVTVSVPDNTSYDIDRTATILLKSGASRITCEVTQTKGEKPDYLENMVIPEGYALVWNDEFEASRTAAGKAALPDESLWWFETGDGGWGNNEIQNYIPAYRGVDTCAFICDGTLKIKLKKTGNEVLSVRMNTKESWTYGYFEARLKLPVGKGTWPAFWMMPQNFTGWPKDGEIDIMEHVGYHPNYVSSSIHCTAYYHSIGTQKTSEVYVPTANSEFHTYALEWTEDYICTYVDGKQLFRFNNDQQNNYDTWPFYKPFYLKLNLAWGGNWGGAMGIDESCLPATYEIDYVRVFKKK